MATVYFAPNEVIKYVGSKSKEFVASLARPKPKLKKGDFVIVDKKTAFNLTKKGFGEFVKVDSITFNKSDVATEEKIQSLEDKLDAYKNENNSLFHKLTEATATITKLKEEQAMAKAIHKDSSD